MIRRLAIALTAATAIWLLPVGVFAAASSTVDNAETVALPQALCQKIEVGLYSPAGLAALTPAQRRLVLSDRSGTRCTMVRHHATIRSTAPLQALAAGIITPAAAVGCPWYAPYEWDTYFDYIDLYSFNIHLGSFHNNWGVCYNNTAGLAPYLVYYKWHSCDGWTAPGYGWDRDWCGVGEGGSGTNYIQLGFNWDFFPWSCPVCKQYGKNRSYFYMYSDGSFYVGDTSGFPCFRC